LPNPTVPETAAVSAWKCEISPGSLIDEYFPRIVFSATGKPLMLMKPK
jgi:hypothetical protein